MEECDRALTPPVHLLPGHLRARLPHRRRRGARLRPAVGLRAGPLARADPGRPALPPRRPRRRAHHRRRHAPPPRRARARRRRRGPPGGAAGPVAGDRHHPLRHVRHRPPVRRRRPGGRRPGPAPRGARGAHRPELHRRLRAAAPRPHRGGDDRGLQRHQRGHDGAAGGPRRARLRQRPPRPPHGPDHAAAPQPGRARHARDHLAGRGLHPDRAAPDAPRDRAQPADPHRGRGRRDRGRAGRHGAGRHGHEPRRRHPADPPAGPGGGHGLAAAASSTTPSPSSTAPGPSSARRRG